MLVTTALTLADLPDPPPDKKGWPWTEQSTPLPERQPNGEDWPCISIVTPSYNQAQYLEETIRSVLLQGYPNLEYIIMDGGSTDESIDVIKKYESFLAYWISEPDEGQSNAVNKGFGLATGELIGWQNSDDFYAENTFHNAASLALNHKEYEIFHGSMYAIDQDGKFLRPSNFSELNLINMLPWSKVYNQSSFFRKSTLGRSFFLDESFHHCMDLELFWRLALQGRKFYFDPKISAFYRVHSEAKSTKNQDIAAVESTRIYVQIARNKELEKDIRHKALSCIHSQSIYSFDRLNIPLFYQLFTQLVLTGGLKSLSLQIILLYILGLLGKENIAYLKGVKYKLKNGNYLA